MPKTRQLRLNDPNAIRKKVSDLVGKQVTIVMTDNRVSLGTVEGVSGEQVALKNLRLKQNVIALTHIAELYYDTVS